MDAHEPDGHARLHVPSPVLHRARTPRAPGQGFAKWQLPDRYEAIPAVPRTSTGKFWKLRLREMFPR